MIARRLLSAGLIALSVAACGTPQEAPRDQFYRLDTDFAGQASQPVFDGTLEVGRFLADGLLGERALVYTSVDTPDRLLQYHYHYWVEPPPRMLQEQLVRVLRDANVAPVVVTSEQRADPAYVVSAKLRRMEQVIRRGNPMVALSMEFSLRRERDGKLLLLQVYEVEREAQDLTMPGTVQAMNAALTDVYAAFVRDLRGVAR